MPRYADLAPAVRAVVDRKAKEAVALRGGDLQAMRETIAAGVSSHTPQVRRGH